MRCGILLVLSLLLAGCLEGAQEPADPALERSPDAAADRASPEPVRWRNGTWAVTAAATTTVLGDGYAPGGGTEPLANCVLVGDAGARLTHATVEATWDPALGALRLFAWTRDVGGDDGARASTVGTGHAVVDLDFDGHHELVALGVFSDGDPDVGAPVEVELGFHVEHLGSAPFVGPERCTP